jgi:hypothetical protein
MLLEYCEPGTTLRALPEEEQEIVWLGCFDGSGGRRPGRIPFAAFGDDSILE